jgi:hypothetical protein
LKKGNPQRVTLSDDDNCEDPKWKKLKTLGDNKEISPQGKETYKFITNCVFIYVCVFTFGVILMVKSLFKHDKVAQADFGKKRCTKIALNHKKIQTMTIKFGNNNVSIEFNVWVFVFMYVFVYIPNDLFCF